MNLLSTEAELLKIALPLLLRKNTQSCLDDDWCLCRGEWHSLSFLVTILGDHKQTFILSSWTVTLIVLVSQLMAVVVTNQEWTAGVPSTSVVVVLLAVVMVHCETTERVCCPSSTWSSIWSRHCHHCRLHSSSSSSFVILMYLLNQHQLERAVLVVFDQQQIRALTAKTNLTTHPVVCSYYR